MVAVVIAMTFAYSINFLVGANSFSPYANKDAQTGKVAKAKVFVHLVAVISTLFSLGYFLCVGFSKFVMPSRLWCRVTEAARIASIEFSRV